MFCLIPKLADSFRDKILSGEINPLKLSKLSSAERRSFFSEHLGGDLNAKEVNALFESKILLKNQQLGYINWAKQMLGEKHPAYRDVISRIEKMDKVLKPENEKAFLEDLVSKKLGTDITFEEAKTIAELSKKMKNAEKKIKPDSPDGSPETLEYGAYKRALQNYVDDLKISNKKEPLSVAGVADQIAGTAKGIKSSMDDSAVFNQGGKIKFTHPVIWAKNAFKSFGDIMTQIKDGAEANRVMDGTMAYIYGMKNMRNGNFRRMKLDIGELEEAFPTPIPEKIPVFGRLYKASEVAYSAFLRRTRADIANKMIDIAEKEGINIVDKFEAESIGKVINSLTGRGSLGKFEAAGKAVNNVFFSPKKLMGDIDVLTAHRLHGVGARGISKFAKRQATVNLIKYVTGTAMIMKIADLLMPGSIEWDPRSADFGTIRVKDTRFDITGGSKAIAVLAARLISQKSKSSTSGNITELNSGEFGAMTGMDMVWNFLENKLSPASTLIKELAINRTDFEGKPITVEKAMADAFVPLPISNAYEVIKNPNGANALLTIIADGLGIMTNTYSAPVKKPKPKSFR